MGIHVGTAASQASSLQSHAAALREVVNGLTQDKAALNQAWQADEMRSANAAVDRILSELSQTISDLQSLSGDIVSVANEIRQEELAREAAARAALEREAAARAAAAQSSPSSSYRW
ncbi:hypothetical protein [Cohnella boryungensis]|uniref:WXG100 family type VII secretion target n=1 Tax=Cohnella boryungensis TaxID=768479 RepID=A0ABV8S785_9BACL